MAEVAGKHQTKALAVVFALCHAVNTSTKPLLKIALPHALLLQPPCGRSHPPPVRPRHPARGASTQPGPSSAGPASVQRRAELWSAMEFKRGWAGLHSGRTSANSGGSGQGRIHRLLIYADG